MCSELRWRMMFIATFLLQQFAWNVILTVQAGLVPDRVPVEQQNSAGGATAAFTLTGALGALLLVHLTGGLGLQTHYSIAISLAVLCTLAVCWAADERSSLTSTPGKPGEIRGLMGQLRDAYQLDVRRHPEFAKLLLSKTMYNSSVMVKGFLLFFLQDTFTLKDTSQAQALVGQVAIAAETTAALSALLAMMMLDCAKPSPHQEATSPQCATSTFGALCLPTEGPPNEAECPTPSCATGRLLARRSAVYGAGWMGMLWFGPLLVGLGVLHSRAAGENESSLLTSMWMPYMVLGTAIWGIGQGVYLAGDQALGYALLPDAEEASRFLGLSSVCACVGAIFGGSLTGGLLWSFGGGASNEHTGHASGPGYQYPGYAAMFVLAAGLSWAASMALFSIRVRATTEA
jgi:hypothetical protein